MQLLLTPATLAFVWMVAVYVHVSPMAYGAEQWQFACVCIARYGIRLAISF